MLELGEKLRDGIAREVREETGLEIEAGEVLDVFDSIFPDANGGFQYHYVLIDFLCRPVGGQLQASSDVDAAQWVTSDELDQLHMRDVTIAVIRKALEKSGAETHNP
jgi:ADP-ribose pyrophosphatase YjhB (NUDIX family)